MNLDNQDKKDYFAVLKTHAKKIIFLALSLIVIFLILIFFDYKKKENKNNISESFIQGKIFLDRNKTLEAKNIFLKIINEKDSIYSPLSLFLIIDKGLEEDKKKVAQYFDEILLIKNMDKDDKNLIKLKKAIFISDEGEEKQILDLLNPIINSESVWKIQSVQFLGDYYYSLKQFKKSKEYYSILLNENHQGLDYKQIRRRIDLIENE